METMASIGMGLALFFVGLIFLVAVLVALSDLPFSWSDKLAELKLIKLAQKIFVFIGSGWPSSRL